MNKMNMIAGLVIGTLMAVSTSAMAGDHDKKGYDRHAGNNQHRHFQVNHKPQPKPRVFFTTAKVEKRIAAGKKNGQLTRDEVRLLDLQLAQLQSIIKVVSRDNQITNWERKHVENKTNALNQMCTNLLYNKQVVKKGRGHGHDRGHGKQQNWNNFQVITPVNTHNTHHKK